jgi:hypothetical protein
MLGHAITIHCRSFIGAEVSALITISAVLVAGLLAKLGYSWWGVTVITPLCFLDGARSSAVGGAEH